MVTIQSLKVFVKAAHDFKMQPTLLSKCVKWIISHGIWYSKIYFKCPACQISMSLIYWAYWEDIHCPQGWVTVAADMLKVSKSAGETTTKENIKPE